jgi:hypothetical protein
MSDILKQITIPTPCHANWDSMTGDDRTRLCQVCGKSVVNLAALTVTEAESLVAEQGEGTCAKVTKRKDGSVVTAKPHPRYRIRSLMMLIAWIAGALGLFRIFNQFAIDDGKALVSKARPEAESDGGSVRVGGDSEMIMGMMVFRGRPEVQAPKDAH